MASIKMHLENRFVIVSAKKIGNKSTGTTLSMLKIYSRLPNMHFKSNVQNLNWLCMDLFCNDVKT